MTYVYINLGYAKGNMTNVHIVFTLLSYCVIVN